MCYNYIVNDWDDHDKYSKLWKRSRNAPFSFRKEVRQDDAFNIH